MAYDKNRQSAIDLLKKEIEKAETFYIQGRSVIATLEKLQKEGTVYADMNQDPQRDGKYGVSLGIDIITKAGRFLHTSEIRKAITKDFPTVKPTYIIFTLSNAKAAKAEIIKIPLHDLRKTAYFGLKEWLDENGDIKQAYKPI